MIFKSTNGTKSFFRLIDSEDVFAISLLNLGYSVKAMFDLAVRKNKDIFLVCSGTKGKITYEDVYTAGMAVEYFMQLADLQLSDPARIALDVITANKELDTMAALEQFEYIERLKKWGYYEDLKFSARLDIYNVVSGLKVLDLNDEQAHKQTKDHKELYDQFALTRNSHPFEKILFLQRF